MGRRRLGEDGSHARTETPQGINDPHHCRCFVLDREWIGVLKRKLIRRGFGQQIAEEDHGQVWGLRKKLTEREQIHVKAMPDGLIESEMEPPPEYPVEHLNPRHSYSAHKQVLSVLRSVGIRFRRVRDTPPTCAMPKIVRPKRYTHWVTIAIVMALVAAAIALVVYAISKRRS